MMRRYERTIALRCAVCVSTDSGLEQDFNSLMPERKTLQTSLTNFAGDGGEPKWEQWRAIGLQTPTQVRAELS